jgi:hypothetical protein
VTEPGPEDLLIARAAKGDQRAFERLYRAHVDRVNVSNIAGTVSISTWDRREIDVQGELGSGVERVEVNQDTGNVEFCDH